MIGRALATLLAVSSTAVLVCLGGVALTPDPYAPPLHLEQR